MNILKRFIPLLFVLVLSACPYYGNDDYEFEYETIVTSTPVNLEGINSSHDDYNSDLPYPYAGYDIFFSSNRTSGGLYFDIKFTHHLKSDFGTWRAEEVISGPDTLEVVNSESDDLYPCITDDQSRMFFCSNRVDDLFDIYCIPLPGEAELHDFFTSDTSGEPVVNTTLSSAFNDKCPSINKDVLLFASDREGGFGGFDLYFSLYENGAWSEPVNFGPEINSEYNEYRPILVPFWDPVFEYLVIFSSDRPGGLGGFDLYMVKAGSVVRSHQADF